MECELYGAGGAARFKASLRAAWWSFHWSGSQASSSLNFVCGKFINSCVRYSCGSSWCRRQVLVKLARIANVRPPRGLPTKREFFLFNTTRFISRSLALCRLLDYAARMILRAFLSTFRWSVTRHNSYGLFRLASMPDPDRERSHENRSAPR